MDYVPSWAAKLGLQSYAGQAKAGCPKNDQATKNPGDGNRG